jgi:hypothetical protein
MNRDVQTKEEAIDFVAMVMLTPLALMSPDFKLAMELSERFDITAQDVLMRRKKKALHR